MVFNSGGLNPREIVVNIILAIVAITMLGALLPTAVDTLINLTTDLFAGTIFAPIFANGLIVYGVLAVGMVALIFKMFGFKTN